MDLLDAYHDDEDQTPAPAPAPLPVSIQTPTKPTSQPLWHVVTDDATGCDYYWDLNTGRVSWDPPPELLHMKTQINSSSGEQEVQEPLAKRRKTEQSSEITDTYSRVSKLLNEFDTLKEVENTSVNKPWSNNVEDLRAQLQARECDWVDGGLADSFYLCRLRKLLSQLEATRSLQARPQNLEFDLDTVDTLLDDALEKKIKMPPATEKQETQQPHTISDEERKLDEYAKLTQAGPDTSLAGKCETAPQSVSSKPVSSAPQNDLEFVHPQRKQILQGALQSTEQQKPPAKQKPRGVLVSPTGLQSSKQVWKKVQIGARREVEPPSLASLEREKQHRIDKWRQEQLESGGADANPNFQKLNVQRR